MTTNRRNDMPQHWSDARWCLWSILVAFCITEVLYLVAHAKGWVP